MFRKILIAAVASLALLAPFAMPTVSDAHPAPVVHHHYPHHRPIHRPVINYWTVYYRTSCNSPWLYQGTYGSYLSAQLAAQSIGFETMIR